MEMEIETMENEKIGIETVETVEGVEYRRPVYGLEIEDSTMVRDMILRDEKNGNGKPKWELTPIPNKFNRNDDIRLKCLSSKFNSLEKDLIINNKKFKISTPALKIAHEFGILNEINYLKIKHGGLPVLESYTNTPGEIKNCYDKIKDISNDKRIIIVVNKEKHFVDKDGEIHSNNNLKKLLDLNNSRLAQEILDNNVEHPLKKIFA
jgi:hypothetical protein